MTFMEACVTAFQNVIAVFCCKRSSLTKRLNNLIQQRNIQTALQNPLVTFLISRCELYYVHQS